MARFLVIGASLVALAAPTSAHAAPVFLFDRPNAQPNERVTVRTTASPARRALRLWAGLERDGTYAVPADRVGADGAVGNKLLWVTTPPWERPTLSGERIDAAAPSLQVSGVNTGSLSGAANPSHMSPVGFPTAGCWRVRARLGDLSLVYVVRVVVEETPQPG